MQTKHHLGEKRNRKSRAMAIAAIIVLIFVIALVALYVNRANQPIGTPPLNIIVNGNIQLDSGNLTQIFLDQPIPGSYKAYNFTLPAKISSCHVEGDFAVNPMNSSIRVIIWDNAAFMSWQGGHVSKSPPGDVISFYDSGSVNNATIDGRDFPSGTYWLLFFNISDEPVNVTVQVTYWYLIKS